MDISKASDTTTVSDEASDELRLHPDSMLLLLYAGPDWMLLRYEDSDLDCRRGGEDLLLYEDLPSRGDCSLLLYADLPSRAERGVAMGSRESDSEEREVEMPRGHPLSPTLRRVIGARRLPPRRLFLPLLRRVLLLLWKRRK